MGVICPNRKKRSRSRDKKRSKSRERKKSHDRKRRRSREHKRSRSRSRERSGRYRDHHKASVYVSHRLALTRLWPCSLACFAASGNID